jgi:hypothetical protein
MSLKNPVTPPGIDSGTVGLEAQRLNHYANPGSSSSISINISSSSSNNKSKRKDHLEDLRADGK